jgi:hypothetical protein
MLQFAAEDRKLDVSAIPNCRQQYPYQPEASPAPTKPVMIIVFYLRKYKIISIYYPTKKMCFKVKSEGAFSAKQPRLQQKYCSETFFFLFSYPCNVCR